MWRRVARAFELGRSRAGRDPPPQSGLPEPGEAGLIQLLSATGLPALSDVGRGLEESFFMFWETAWALVLGFGLSGAVQAFVSRQAMQARLGDHRPASILRASAYGMVSSSCSYAASAMAKSLVAKGADFVAGMVFMFASTNLVVELGLVLVVLIGWQFAAAEFVGGAIMIVLLALAGAYLLTGRPVEVARSRLSAASGDGSNDNAEALQHQPWARRLRSGSGWADAASYTMADLTMLRREMLVGYLIAGFLAALVPTGVWNAVFLHGHGTWTQVENVVVGPFIAIISFVCSIGNVPLAAALWHGGISFGGVVSFVFADLIALPLLLIYRKFYGGHLALRMLAVFWAVMAVAGLSAEAIFTAAGIVPTVRPLRIVPERFSVDYTTVLNIVFLVVFAVLYFAYRNRERLGGGAGYAIDPVCGMQVERANAPATDRYEGRRFYFCSDRCAERFATDPAGFAAKRGRAEAPEPSEGHA